jgi:hypothetical protein
MFSPPRNSLESKQLYIDTSDFCHAPDKIAVPSQIGHDYYVRNEYAHAYINVTIVDVETY